MPMMVVGVGRWRRCGWALVQDGLCGMGGMGEVDERVVAL